jgi:hypothetical protein
MYFSHINYHSILKFKRNDMVPKKIEGVNVAEIC